MLDYSAGLPSPTLDQTVQVLPELVLLPEAENIDTVGFLQMEQKHPQGDGQPAQEEDVAVPIELLNF